MLPVIFNLIDLDGEHARFAHPTPYQELRITRQYWHGLGRPLDLIVTIDVA